MRIGRQLIAVFLSVVEFGLPAGSAVLNTKCDSHVVKDRVTGIVGSRYNCYRRLPFDGDDGPRAFRRAAA